MNHSILTSRHYRVIWIVSEYRVDQYDFTKLCINLDQILFIGTKNSQKKLRKKIASLSDHFITAPEITCEHTYMRKPDIRLLANILGISFFKENPNIQLYFDEEVVIEDVGRLNEKLKCKGLTYHQSQYFRDKAVMKEALRECEHFHIPTSAKAINEIQPPFIIKPRKSAGALHTDLINNRHEQQVLLQNKPLNTEIMIIEEFIPGDVYHCDLIMRDDRIIFFGVGRYLKPLMEATQKHHIMGSELINTDNVYYNRLKKACVEIHSKLEVKNMITHTEFIVNNEELYFIETGLRPAGGWVPSLYKRALNINIFNLNFNTFMGKEDYNHGIERYPYSLGICILPTKDGTIKKFNQPQALTSKLYCQFNTNKIQQSIKKTYSAFDSLGEIILYSKDKSNYLTDKNTLMKMNFITYQ